MTARAEGSEGTARVCEGAPREVLRILDANLNRLREALRVVEEYFRFVENVSALSVELKRMRHDVGLMERAFGAQRLLAGRDAEGDPLAHVNAPEERRRGGPADIARASLKRAEEAARVIEEYAKVSDAPQCCETAKGLRFRLYSFEKRLMENTLDASRE